MRKLILGALATLMLVGGAFSAGAAPDPNGPAKKGLCTAYFNGQKNGHDKDGDGRSTPPPFYGLEGAAGAEPGDSPGEVAYAVSTFCGSLVGGNPSHGRWNCGTTTDTDNDDRQECTNNPSPGKS